VLELHAVGNLGERIVTGEIADAARLRSVMLRATKMLPWNCGSSLSILEPVSDTGMVCAPRVRTTVSRVSCAACSRSKPSRSRSSSIATMLRPRISSSP
jgi:hypothetical protein